MPSRTTVFTIGHSTRPADEFVAMLAGHGVKMLVDVRSVPRSRHNPQFNRDSLPATLAHSGVEYAYAGGLGGFRPTRADSPNGGWHNSAFRGYADYMQTVEFADNLFFLMRMADQEPVALMCAEAVPWRCHRSLLADALLVHGYAVDEIVSATRLQPHRLTPFAQIDGARITYPPYE